MPLITPVGVTLLNVWDSVRSLSLLGRLQVFILMCNVIGTCAVLNVASAERKQRLDTTVFYFSLEFAFFTIIGVLFTITVENVYAFWALIFLQVQLGAFTTASALIGDLHQERPWLAWTVVSINWLSIIAFLALQRAVRKTWGWHAYHLVGGNPQNVALYDKYQQFCAALIADVFHAVFFATAEEVVIRSPFVWQHALVYSVVCLTVILAKALQISVRREHVVGLVFGFCFYALGLGMYLFFAISNTIEDNSRSTNLDQSSGLPSAGQRQLVLAIEWCIVAVRIVTIWTIVRSTKVFGHGLSQFFPGGQATNDHAYLITAEDIGAANAAANTRQSRAATHRSVDGIPHGGGFISSNTLKQPVGVPVREGSWVAAGGDGGGGASSSAGTGYGAIMGASVTTTRTSLYSPRQTRFLDATTRAASVVSVATSAAGREAADEPHAPPTVVPQVPSQPHLRHSTLQQSASDAELSMQRFS